MQQQSRSTYAVEVSPELKSESLVSSDQYKDASAGKFPKKHSKPEEDDLSLKHGSYELTLQQIDLEKFSHLYIGSYE